MVTPLYVALTRKMLTSLRRGPLLCPGIPVAALEHCLSVAFPRRNKRLRNALAGYGHEARSCVVPSSLAE